MKAKTIALALLTCSAYSQDTTWRTARIPAPIDTSVVRTAALEKFHTMARDRALAPLQLQGLAWLAYRPSHGPLNVYDVGVHVSPGTDPNTDTVSIPCSLLLPRGRGTGELASAEFLLLEDPARSARHALYPDYDDIPLVGTTFYYIEREKSTPPKPARSFAVRFTFRRPSKKDLEQMGYEPTDVSTADISFTFDTNGVTTTRDHYRAISVVSPDKYRAEPCGGGYGSPAAGSPSPHR